MTRSNQLPATLLTAMAVLCVASTGCLHQLVATGMYVFQGGNVVDAACTELEGERVVVLVRPPASNEYRHAGAARAIGARVSSLLQMKVDGIDVVSQQEVDNWVDEQDWENFQDLGRAVKASRVVYVEIDSYDLYKGKTLYQGDAEIKVSVYDMKNRGKLLYENPLGQVLFPKNSGIPAADKPVQHFQAQFTEVVSNLIAEHFYNHNPNSTFAMDAVANK
ncbi:hypothetical protein [Adhaeretor mobilis]|uniref:Uncharacterized protein n=1 Tax=Adhaeretor mobilis TaxID=1930276 RepID=A0A517N051_9BACT|nr:hypothetical protein [Adhaeretor mobilis]QDT00517.1 hypothetical protein HG15A2_38550 [Adhaeretor mobilis]